MPLITNKKIATFFCTAFESSLSSSDIMPGYTASHSACKKTTNLRAKFYGKTALNGEIPVNKYQNNINHVISGGHVYSTKELKLQVRI